MRRIDLVFQFELLKKIFSHLILATRFPLAGFFSLKFPSIIASNDSSKAAKWTQQMITCLSAIAQLVERPSKVPQVGSTLPWV